MQVLNSWMVHKGKSHVYKWMMPGGTPILGNLSLGACLKLDLALSQEVKMLKCPDDGHVGGPKFIHYESLKRLIQVSFASFTPTWQGLYDEKKPLKSLVSLTCFGKTPALEHQTEVTT